MRFTHIAFLLPLSIIISFVFILSLVDTAISADGAVGGSAGGSAMFAEKKCTSCHSIKKPATITIDSALDEKGPPLWYAGDKFKDGFIEGWLKKPKVIRPMEYRSIRVENKGGHVKLPANEAALVATYLMTLKGPVIKTPTIKAKRSVRGRIILEKKQGCYGCHLLKKRKSTIGGMSGPTLVGAGERLRPEWVYAYLKSPKSFEDVSAMPIYTGILSERDLKKLAAHIGSFTYPY
jgi:mono/diheme cytochrome c family protein